MLAALQEQGHELNTDDNDEGWHRNLAILPELVVSISDEYGESVTNQQGDSKENVAKDDHLQMLSHLSCSSAHEIFCSFIDKPVNYAKHE